MSAIPLGDMSVDHFLSHYWQKKPVLIRQAFPKFQAPFEPDELAGLALSEGVLSRLILEQGGDYPWQLKQGPFEESEFDKLGDHHWTLLVQEVDKHVPAVADLFDRFTFLPSWRKDDVMVSFAAKDAGVGAHTDSYDVFLLQGSGKRRWEIGPPSGDSGPLDGGIRAAGSAQGGPSGGGLNTSESDYIKGLDVRILANFEATEVFELEPGDMLYLPPGVPHNGVAIEPCLTFSFGFLAPTQAEMTADFCDWFQTQSGPNRYSDPDLSIPQGPGLITTSDLTRVHQLLTSLPQEPELLADWFGPFITRPQRAPAALEEFEGSLDDFHQDFQESGLWRRHEAVRVACWLEGVERLFADGETVGHKMSADILQRFTDNRQFEWDEVKNHESLLETLYHFTCRGWGYLHSELEDDFE